MDFSWITKLLNQDLVLPLMGFLPKFLTGLVIVFLGLVIAQVSKLIVGRSLGFMAKWRERMGVGISQATAKLVSTLTFWVIFLVFLTSATKTIGFESATQILKGILGYVPNLILAVVTVIIAIIIARIIKRFAVTQIKRSGIVFAPVIGNAIEAVLILFAIIMAIDQLGVNTAILVSNINIIIAAFAFAFALSFGLGAKDAVSNIIASYYVKQLYKVGDKIVIGETKGKVKNITNIAIIVETPEGETVIPNKEILSSKTSK